MIYSFYISTPKNTTKADRQQTTLKLSKGVIYKIEIMFPPGNGGTLHLGLREGLHQVWPSNPDEYFFGDNRLISFPEYYPIVSEPYTLIAETWNESLNNAHILSITIGVLPRKHVVRRII